ncbi:hypothetical protein [Clostridium sp. AM42-4]|uniref:hypothetical protein n=1 Tax=Clostridium sp. AM42-4 TaxID=2292305 RepID=UPI000E48787D|nr:hypothetical protein [Clostridium sp. AM42-4]RHS88717.1 hypothetical protein DW922_05850 [Clostridium sp. AM42-4]
MEKEFYIKDKTPLQYLQSIVNFERFQTYLQEKDLGSAYNYLNNIYMVMLDTDQDTRGEAVGIYERHLEEIHKQIGTLKSLKEKRMSIIKPDDPLLGKVHLETLRESLIHASIAYLSNVDSIRFERTYDGLMIDRHMNNIPELAYEDRYYKTPYAIFSKYIQFFADTISMLATAEEYNRLPQTIKHVIAANNSGKPNGAKPAFDQKKNSNIKTKKNVRHNHGGRKIWNFFKITIVICLVFILKISNTGKSNTYQSAAGDTNTTARMDNAIPQQIADRNTMPAKLLFDDRQPDMQQLANRVSEENVKIQYEWESPSGSWKNGMTMELNMGVYMYYRGLPRQYSNDCKNYISDEYTVSMLKRTNETIDELCEKENMSSEWAKVQETVAFVQAIPYKTDEESVGQEEWYKYPYETLVDQCGDCEDKTFLLAGLLKERGYDVVILIMPDHMALGIAGTDIPGSYYERNGKKYYYVETTSSGWKIGDIPNEYRCQKAEVVPIV